MAAFIALVCSVASFGFAEESKKDLMDSEYAKVGISALPTGANYSVAPSVTYGKRGIYNGHGVDISTSFSGVQVAKENNDDDDWYTGYSNFAIHYSAPKVMYIRFVEPTNGNKLYVGGGSSLSGTHFKGSDFFGLTANGLVGYAIDTDKLSTFVQFDCSKPMVPVYQSKKFNNQPVYEISFGLGF